jgi:uncharacterized iron-regulated membrane protein
LNFSSSSPELSLLQRWVRQPQRVWLRRALFQIHLWTGLGVGLYIFVVSITGSVIVLRTEAYRVFRPGTRIEARGETPLGEELMRAAAQRAYPDHAVARVIGSFRRNAGTEIWLVRDGHTIERLFDPYTGEDLGSANPSAIRLFEWMVDLHDNLLAGQRGRFVNGIGALFLTLLCLTGFIIWWPGSSKWRRSLFLRRGVGWKRLIWELHSAVGFWTVAFVAMWAISGLYLAIPQPFQELVDYVGPLDRMSPSLGDEALAWLARLHFGRFAGWPLKTLWVTLGLMAPLLFVTGAVMWWNRILGPKWRG